MLRRQSEGRCQQPLRIANRERCLLRGRSRISGKGGLGGRKVGGEWRRNGGRCQQPLRVANRERCLLRGRSRVSGKGRLGGRKVGGRGRRSGGRCQRRRWFGDRKGCPQMRRRRFHRDEGRGFHGVVEGYEVCGGRPVTRVASPGRSHFRERGVVNGMCGLRRGRHGGGGVLGGRRCRQRFWVSRASRGRGPLRW